MVVVVVEVLVVLLVVELNSLHAVLFTLDSGARVVVVVVVLSVGDPSSSAATIGACNRLCTCLDGLW